MKKAADPESIERAGESALKVRWADGHESLYPWGYLRGRCPCAMCREAPPAVELPVKAQDLSPVGRYALGVRFSDGHATGIFSFEYLRSICPCEECRPTQMTEG